MCSNGRKAAWMADKTYTLSFEQQVSRPLPEIFDFFSRAENLEVLTPPWLNFKILSVKPQPVQKGTLINYSLHVHGIPLRWTSEIVEWEPPHRFVDLQLRALTSSGGMSIVLRPAMAEL